TGLQCMTERLAAAWSAKQVLAAGSQLYQCTGQLYASDYVYADSFASGADAALKQVGASGVPTSQFVKTTDIALVTKAGIGATQTVTFPGLFASSSTAPKYSVPYKVTVTSLRVPGEHNLSNNTATYSVEFLLS